MAIGLGFVIGLGHAFEPDHVAAVSTQVSKLKSQKVKARDVLKNIMTKTTILGALWGAGHTTTLVLVGFLVYVLAISIQPQIFATLELCVGIMLVFLGITAILNRNKFFKTKHSHPHQHKDGTIHFDEHSHWDSNHEHTHKSYLIGLVHGLAGSGSLVVLTAATLDNIGLVLGFIVIFGVGSMIGMALVGSLMGVPLVLGNKIGLIQKTFRYVAGLFSLVIGFNIMYQFSLVGQLFGI